MVTGNSTFKNSACHCVDISIKSTKAMLCGTVGLLAAMKTVVPKYTLRFYILCQVLVVKKKKKMPLSLRNIFDASEITYFYQISSLEYSLNILTTTSATTLT